MATKVQMPSKEDMMAAYEEIAVKEQIPEPSGWRMLVMMPALPRKTAGGILLTDNYIDAEEIASPIGLVVKMGPLCYTDKRKFVDGVPWCKVGDIAVFRSYSGTRIVIQDREFRMITDEGIDGVVEDPRGVERI